MGITPEDQLAQSTVNIDTPEEYAQLIPIPRMHEIAALWPGLVVDDDTHFELWVRLVVRDASGNVNEREVSYVVRVDERPVLDVVSPLPGSRAVEGSMLDVNVHAFDDVGIDHLRLVATHGVTGAEVANLVIRQAPFQFSFPVPAFDESDPDMNRMTLHVEAIDLYGAATNDLDAHRALELTDVEIVRDQPPVVAIGLPHDGDSLTEGEYMLVQVNAVDDVGVETVTLEIEGLDETVRSFVDTRFPFEFLIEVPYGTAGRTLSLTAQAVEQRTLGEPRIALTPSPTHVHVERDSEAPLLTVLAPDIAGHGRRASRAALRPRGAPTTCRVSSVTARVFADKNRDGTFAEDEDVGVRLMTALPFVGSLSMRTIAEYAGAEDVGTTLPLQVIFTAVDGAGNESVATRQVTLIKNEPPTVERIQVLDARGFSLGSSVTQLTEGRGIVVQIVARDVEIGVESVRLYMAVGDTVEVADFDLVGQDSAAPFQFHMDVPVGRVGEQIRFWADAKDLDGYRPALRSTQLRDGGRPSTHGGYRRARLLHSGGGGRQDIVVTVEPATTSVPRGSTGSRSS
ncbi:MAG: hypothetical protein IPG81_18050 [Sandaracinaceae bacterium]|nr:hypothetical protein [Sandaracinaceae bacterium]